MPIWEYVKYGLSGSRDELRAGWFQLKEAKEDAGSFSPIFCRLFCAEAGFAGGLEFVLGEPVDGGGGGEGLPAEVHAEAI